MSEMTCTIERETVGGLCVGYIAIPVINDMELDRGYRSWGPTKKAAEKRFSKRKWPKVWRGSICL